MTLVALATTDQESLIEDPTTHRMIKSDERLFVLVKPALVIQREQRASMPLLSNHR